LKTYDDLVVYEVNRFLDFKMMGSLVDALDYFITIYEYNKNVKFVLLNSSIHHKMKLEQFVLNRYNLPKQYLLDMCNNMIVLLYPELRMSIISKLLLVDYHTVHIISKYCPIICNDIHVIVENGTEGIFPNAKYYNEIPEIFKVQDIGTYVDYTMKMRFDILKECSEEGTESTQVYVNHRNNPGWVTPTQEYLDEHQVVTKKMNDMFSDNWFFKQDKPVDNLFDYFGTYVYYQSCEWFDTHPRLFAECSYYNKDIIYMNPRNVQDGAYYRYKDLMENGIEHRHLTKDDEIVQAFIND